MLYRREGWPEEDELVLCTVTGIQPYSVFARLDEYGKTGLIHISEISSGRVRNIREYVQVNEKIVCKVLRVDKDKGHIDLSLRRVNEGQKRAKLNEIKQEQFAERIVEHVAHKNKQTVETVYHAVTDAVFKKYPALFTAFKDVADDKLKLEDLGMEKKLAADITEEVKNRLVAEEVTVKGDITLHTTASNGVVLIRDMLVAAKALAKNVSMTYLGNGVYHVTVTADDYKQGEKALKALAESILEQAKKQKVAAEFKEID
jgi:translation initiation factor 2 subunit 1